MAQHEFIHVGSQQHTLVYQSKWTPINVSIGPNRFYTCCAMLSNESNTLFYRSKSGLGIPNIDPTMAFYDLLTTSLVLAPRCSRIMQKVLSSGSEIIQSPPQLASWCSNVDLKQTKNDRNEYHCELNVHDISNMLSQSAQMHGTSTQTPQCHQRL